VMPLVMSARAKAHLRSESVSMAVAK
jgi:hypothetical protein